MVNLATKYMGLNLKNPIIVSSCSLTHSADGVKRCADAGAGAVVLKSLFEEQINADVKALANSTVTQFHAEEWDYIQRMGLDMNADEYLTIIEESKARVDIPVIASLNCISGDRWTEFAKYIEKVGADAIELNIAVMPREFDEDPEKIEKHIYSIISNVKKEVNIPIAVKLGPYFTSMPRVAKGARKAGASGLVLFNRFYQTDIDINKLSHESKNKYSSPAEMSNTLRWISLLYQQVGCSLVGNTGIHDGEAVIKQLLVGAKAVEICSTLFVNGMGQINLMLEDLSYWMQEHGYETIDDFRGRMSHKNSKQPEYFERQQYIRALVGVD
ncbi:MAG: dihydroorotate dehydrogenase-like protein [Cyclobacteriaceae bacterium]|nr:dihydroorotate dehydrogenase-like protein [Cyclobacteriaceae bacterium]